MIDNETKPHKDGHLNQAGGCCCPACGNTCGMHPEYNRLSSLSSEPLAVTDEDEDEQGESEPYLLQKVR